MSAPLRYIVAVRGKLEWLAMTEDLPSPDNRVTLTYVPAEAAA